MAARLLWNISISDQFFTRDGPAIRYFWFRLCENCGSQIVDPTEFRFCCTRCSVVYRERMDTAEREAKGRRPSRSWQAIRQEIFHRDNFTCQKCQREFPAKELEVHHIIPVSERGDSRQENLMTECRECHKKERSRAERAKRQSHSGNTFFGTAVLKTGVFLPSAIKKKNPDR